MIARHPRVIGYSAAAAAVLVDQAHKAWMLGPFDITDRGRTPLAPFLDLVLVWNRGVSYGLDPGARSRPRLLIASDSLARSSLAGGSGQLEGFSRQSRWAGDRRALSNVIDRLVHGAVATSSCFTRRLRMDVFNLADVWIVAGDRLGLVWLTERPETPRSRENPRIEPCAGRPASVACSERSCYKARIRWICQA